MRRVSAVEQGGLAERHGLRPGDDLVSINGEAVLDEIDYQALVANRRLAIRFRRDGQNQREVDIIKPEHLPLGITFEDSLIGNPRLCANNCIFCFVDQMPPGMRPTLYVKDDDWRLSLMMGNYVTLTNVGEREFDRIIARRATPLYVSVHATDVDVRKKLMGNERAGDIMRRLRRLKQEDMSFHTQVVLCPGVNDGAVLEQTLTDLLTLVPLVLSIALVPVGLTRYRQALPQVRAYTSEEARDVIALADQYAQEAVTRTGSRLIYAADEFYCLTGAEVPDVAYYEGLPQLENGVGMIRKFEDDLREAHAAAPETGSRAASAPLACGTSIAPYMRRWMADYAPEGVRVHVFPVDNAFFGDTVTVSGLLTGQDLAEQLSKDTVRGPVLLPATMLNSDRTMFLDNMTPDELSAALDRTVRIVDAHGDALYAALMNLKEPLDD
ncbi:MAG: DUF512 domain-containing protein [Clostridiales bacterium]|nr:DUF512 domain-containing protein [Clostridiales bacterium]